MTDLVDQFLLNKDLLGFLTAMYTLKIGQWIYLLWMMIVAVPIYVRTQSLAYVSVIWILFGSIMVATLPAAGFPLGWILLGLGITGILWKGIR